jgi:pyruvate/2-oxoglutarate dehydrogenase complex dihydrolipoamide acyltransferase (E2) component
MLTTRPDGTLVKNLSATRALMPLLMERRSEATVFFEQELDVTDTMQFVDAWNEAHPEERITLFHVFMWAIAATLHERPRLNRFVSGGRIYQRKGVHLSFAAKKKKLDDDAALVTIKREVAPGASMADVAAALHADIRTGRDDAPRPEDREIELSTRFPTFLVKLVLKGMQLLDRWNLLPASVIAHDPLYTSVFVANLGSLGIDAAFHHLYEWGNCPFFAAIGTTRTVRTDRGVRQVATIRYAFDERIDDGLSCARSLELLRRRVEQPAAFEPAAGAAALAA